MMMKFLLFLFSTIWLHTAPVPWLTNFENAKIEAAQSHKTILLSFSGSDWCGPCIRLHKEIFDSESFQNFASSNLVLVNADFPRLKKNQLPAEQIKQNEALADQYDRQGKFPYTVLMDANGKVLKQWEGYPDESPEQFVAEVKEALPSSH